MFRTLYSKLAAVQVGLFTIVGVVSFGATLQLLSLYNLEADQRLNRTLAQHLAQQNQLGPLDAAGLASVRSLFDMQMVINPSIQIYLLDRNGRIIANSEELGPLRIDRVDTAPLEAMLRPGASLPVFGEDPRHPDKPRIFSVAPIPLEGERRGYLYVVLGTLDAGGILAMLSRSDVALLASGVALAIILVGVVSGLAIFALMTRKLEGLADGMDQFRNGNFGELPEVPARQPDRNGDEIDRLGIAFQELAAHIVKQVSELKETDQLRRELVANVSHDLKTPLATLQGYVDTLLLKDDILLPHERRSYLGVASRSCDRLAKLVGDLIDLAKLDANETRLHLEPFSPAELLQDVAQKFQLRASTRNRRVELALPAAPVPFVNADIALVERVLENLIGNALAYTEPGGVIRLGIEAGQDSVVLRVSDTGPGIAEEHIPRIFERFYRGAASDFDQSGHAGLGLAITKSILDLHGSSMTVQSRLGVGTSFAFPLPIARAGRSS